MQRMKIIADENIPLVDVYFSKIGVVTTLPAASIVPSLVQEADVLLVRSVTKVNMALLEGSKVQFVGTATTGIDHIDTAYLAKKGIKFANAHGANAESVVEYVLAALFALGEKYKVSIFEKTVGIIGCGCVGGELIKRLKRLGIKVLQCDPIRAVQEPLNSHFVTLDTLLQEADIVSLHVPLDDSTKNLIADAQFQQMKQGGWLIHTCRGGVVKEAALKSYRHKLEGLVLDVWENEPNIDVELVKMCDIATPHIAGYSYDGKVQGTVMIYEALCKELYMENTDKMNTNYIDVHFEVNNAATSQVIAFLYPILNDTINYKDFSATQFVQYRKEYPTRFAFSAFQL